MESEHIIAALINTKVTADVLADSERNAIISRLKDRFGVNILSRRPWDKNTAPVGKLCHDGWEMIARYVDKNPCILFLNGSKEMWKFSNGIDLQRTLSECPPIEFYICDKDVSYILCHNHHDYVIGWGSATSWVNDLVVS